MKQSFNDIEEAIKVIIESSQKHANATLTGDYKIANKNYYLIKNAVDFLIGNDGIEKLRELLTYNDVSVKVWAASFLLKKDDQKAVAVLQEIESKSIPHHSFDAKILLQEWRKRKLNL
jgi:hypothetical protein